MRRGATRRDFLRMAGAGVLGMSVAACVPTPTPTTAPAEVGPTDTPVPEGKPTPAAKAGPVEIVYGAYSFVPEKQQVIMDEFNKSQPDVHVTAQFAPWDAYWTKIETMAAAGQAFGDVFMGSFHINLHYASRGMLLTLDPYVERDQFPIDNFFPQAVANTRWEKGRIATGTGKLFGLPFNHQTANCFYYNKTIFDEEGVSYPDDTWTWDTMLETAKNMTVDEDGDGSPERWGLMISGGLLWRGGQTFIWQAGGEVWDEPDFTKTLIGSDEARSALQFMADLVLKHKVAPPPGTFPQFDPFTTGQVVMGYEGSWQAAGVYQDITEFDWDIAWIPKHPTTGFAYIDAGNEDSFNISAQSKEPDGAWELLKFITAGKGGEMWCQEINADFAYIPTVEKYTYTKERTKPPLNFHLLIDLFDKWGKPKISFTGIMEAMTAAGEEWGPVLLGERTVDEAVDALVPRFTEILDKAWEEAKG